MILVLLLLNVLVGSLLFVPVTALMLKCIETRLAFCFAGQQSQQPQDYTKAWEEYYKKQGVYSSSGQAGVQITQQEV